MKHQCYESSKGEIIQFEQDIYVDWDAIIDYDWEYETENYILSELSKNAVTKSVDFRIFNKDNRDVELARKNIFDVFERDTKRETPGKIWFNDYYLECFIVGSVNSNYRKSIHQTTKFKILCVDPFWHKEVEHVFHGISSVRSGVDIPTDFTFDLGTSMDEPVRTIDNDCIVSCPFKMVFHGPCTNPSVEIEGHTYRVNGTLLNGERIEITSTKNRDIRSIKKFSGDGTEANWFGHRYKEQSVFEEIPEGTIKIIWDGSFGFSLTLIENRSEPPWKIQEG